MTDLSATLLWVQVGGLLWLALVLQLFYRRVHRERFLRYWALSFAVLGGALALQLALRPISNELIKSHIPYMLGNLQFPLIALAALSLKPPAPSPRQRMLVLAGFLAGLLILFAVTVGLAADQSALTQSLRFERQVLGAATTAWFSLAFWRSPYFARAMGGRVAAVFIALYAVYYAVHAVFAWGIPPYLVGNPVLLRVIAAVLPLGVATGMIVLATQAMIATTKSLRDSEERYRTLVEASPDGIVATDQSGKIFMCNRRAAELHGYASAAELNGTWAPLLIAPADRERLRAAAMMTIEEDRTTRVECQVLLSGGSERSAEVTGAPWRASDGSIAGTVAILHDITERKEADRALRREREFSAHVIDAIPGIFFVQDRQTKAVRWNRNLEDLTGLPPERIYLDDPLNRFHPEDRPRVADAVAGAFASGSAEFEARALLGPSQELRHFHLTARRMELDGVDYLVGCGLDITQRKRAEEDKAKLLAQ